MDELLELLRKEFKFDLTIIRLSDDDGLLTRRSYRGAELRSIIERNVVPEITTYIGEAYLSNKPQFINDTLHITKPESKDLMLREDIKSFAHIPIAREGEPPLGILSVFSKSIVGLFTQPFVALLSSLAGQLAQAVKIDSEMRAKEREREQKERALLENAKVTRDMEIAQQIQLSLLPARSPDLPGTSIACRCVQATHVGGDYYDFFLHDENEVDIIIADVSGHSVGAALIMAETRSVLRAQVYATASAGTILANLNRLLYDDLTGAELFITMIYTKYNAQSRILTYANAGHNPPLVYPGKNARCMELDAEGLILGVKSDVQFEEKSIQLSRGDMVLFYTDGITEARNGAGDLFGTERLCSILKAGFRENPEYLIETILREVTAYSGTTTVEDDISLVVMKVE
jgi:sigma-B regulation protein RsbU (phosphoserine phosphatase)